MIYRRVQNVMAQEEPDGAYSVFLSHSHADAEWVEDLAIRLEDAHQLRPWLDRWVLVPGKPWQRHMARGLQQATSCAVCLGTGTPRGWFEKEIEKALNRQAQDDSFRVIPVLLPGADPEIAADLQQTFLDLNTWVDFRGSDSVDRAFHLLVCGIRGVAPGRWTPRGSREVAVPDAHVVDKLRELRYLREARLIDETVAIDKQGKMLDKYFGI